MTNAGWYPDPLHVHEHRYWSGDVWTEHVADGGTAATAPLDPAVPLSPPDVDPPADGSPADSAGPGAPRRSHAKARLVLAGVLVAILLATGAFVLHGRSASHTSSTPTPTTAVTIPPTTTSVSTPDSTGPCVTDDTGDCATGDTSLGSTSSGSAMSTWANSTSSGGGNASQATNVQSMNTVETDLSTIGHDYSTNADDTTLGADCDQLSQDVLAFPQPDSPDATVNDNLKKASDYLISGSTDCGVDDQSASTELNQAIDYINTAVARIKSFG